MIKYSNVGVFTSASAFECLFNHEIIKQFITVNSGHYVC